MQKIYPKYKRAFALLFIESKILKFYQIYHSLGLQNNYRQMDKRKQPQFRPVQIVQYSPTTINEKSEMEMRREKKKKMMAFKTFLNPVEPPPMDGMMLKRKLSGQQMAEQQLSVSPSCKICNNHLSERSKLCQFCKQMVCIEHIRKKRRNRETNKFSRICDFCEDKYLHQKYLKNQLKIEESLAAQQLILESTVVEVRERLNRKKDQYELLQRRKKQIEDAIVKERNNLQTMQSQLEKATKQYKQNVESNIKLQNKLNIQDSQLPPSLEIDYEFLLQQNDRITDDLVKYDKLCRDAVQARSIREKEMYEEYYEWELLQKQKLQTEQLEEQKKQECQIY